MKVQSIWFDGLMEFRGETTVDLPEKGLVLVTGSNGEGKSALIEAVPAAIWNKTLRGSPWWNQGRDSHIHLTANGWVAKRTRTAGDRNRFVVEGRATYETAAKATAAFEQEMPAFDTWAKTSVYTDHIKPIGGMSDGDLKRLIETVLGLDRFDPESTKVRKELSALKKTLEGLKHQRELLQTKIDAEDQRAEDAVEEKRALKPTDEQAAKDLAKYEKLARETKAELATTRAELRDANNAVASGQQIVKSSISRFAELDREIERLDALQADLCDRCPHRTASEDKSKERDTIAVKEAKAKEALSEDTKRAKRLSAAIEELEDALEDYQAKKTDAEARAGSEDLKVLTATLDNRIKEAKLRATRLVNERGSVTSTLRQNVEALAELEAVDRVLGLQGVRAQMLDGMLGGLEDIANYWLARMPWRESKTIRLSLSSYGEKAKGGVKDSITLKVHGAGGGFGYKALSKGQKRRVDVALLIALAKISHAAHGLADGTLWFDEVFDPLDDLGIRAVADALLDLAKDRCVVVISHSALLQATLQASMHLEVDQGQIYEL